TVVGSVTDPAAVAEAVARLDRLDVLVNNAGISPTFKRTELLEDDEWRAVLDVNFGGALACCRAALPLLEASSGAVGNGSSIHGTVAHERLAAYAASKGALELLTKTLAIEWAPRGIRVNALAPGYLETDMTAALREHPRWRESLLAQIPLGRFATPEEIAG